MQDHDKPMKPMPRVLLFSSHYYRVDGLAVGFRTAWGTQSWRGAGRSCWPSAGTRNFKAFSICRRGQAGRQNRVVI